MHTSGAHSIIHSCWNISILGLNSRARGAQDPPLCLSFYVSYSCGSMSQIKTSLLHPAQLTARHRIPTSTVLHFRISWIHLFPSIILFSGSAADFMYTQINKGAFVRLPGLTLMWGNKGGSFRLHVYNMCQCVTVKNSQGIISS